VDDRADRLLQVSDLLGVAKMVLKGEPHEFFENDSRACNIEIVRQETALVGGTDLLGQVPECFVRRAVEKTLPVLELDVVDMRDELRDIDLVARAAPFNHLLEIRKRQDPGIEGVDNLFLVASHRWLERVKASRVGGAEPDESRKIDFHVWFPTVDR